MECPEATSFFTVSGVTATRVSPASVSAGTPISIEISSEQGAQGMRAELTARLQPSAVAKTLCGFDPKVPMNAADTAI
jgi:hypothetical protein